MSSPRRLKVNRRRVAEWLDRLRGRGPQTDGVVRDDDGESFQLHVALPGFEPSEIAVEIAPDHVVIDASANRERSFDGRGALQQQADLHLLLPFSETIDCARAAARLRGGVLTIRAPRLPQGPHTRQIAVKS